MLKNSKVSARIAQHRLTAENATMLSIERVRTELARVCCSNVRELFDAEGNPKQAHDLDADTAAAIERYEINETLMDGVVVGRRIRIKL